MAGNMKLLRAASAILSAVCFIVVNGAAVEPLQNEVGIKVNDGYKREDSKDTVAPSGDNIVDHRGAAFSPKPQSVISQSKEEKKRNKKGKGKGRKRDPCLKKYKDFCFHGECRYIRQLRVPSCICQRGYHGERCHALILPVENPSYSYDHTTTLAVVAVVLSSVCLIIIGALLLLRYHKRGGYDVESTEKMKLGIAAGPLCTHSE
ncbi:proheparin-binding EGF-like growth factor [Ambystoma mexicanum]|uniref:proheparin-binding EGF-like growth factor n=1 Tax=Ambystoma mexicanum TaxID=8296 RepID=UPI0037E7C0D2